ncbi:porin [Parabacteroides sp.]
MRRLLALCLPVFLAGIPLTATSQKPLIPNDQEVFKLSLETHGSYNEALSGEAERDHFLLNDFKVEATGTVTPWLSYAYRQVVCSHNEWVQANGFGSYIENAWVNFQLSEKLSVTAGKQDAAWGGFEYDEYAYRIYDYSDMNEWMDCYFTGIGISYTLDETQEICFQVTNGNDNRSKSPSFYNIGWNSSYLDEMLSLRYSVTAGQQAKGKWMWMAWAGQQIEAGKFLGYFDVMYTRGEADPLGLLEVQFTDYLSLVTRLNYRFHPKWNIFAKGTYETASVYKTNDIYESGKYRSAWGYKGGVEFYPMADDNLHLFLTASGRAYSLTEKAKALDVSTENTARLSVGFVYKIPLF